MTPQAGNPQAVDPLANLRDIHLPAEIGNWPPAPGWYALAAVILLIIAVLCLWLWRRHRQNAWRRAALLELDGIVSEYQAHSSTTSEDKARCYQQINLLLKRITHQNDSHAASLSGGAWAEYLLSSSRNSLSEEQANLLAIAAYQAAPPDPEPIFAPLNNFIRRYRRPAEKQAAPEARYA